MEIYFGTVGNEIRAQTFFFQSQIIGKWAGMVEIYFGTVGNVGIEDWRSVGMLEWRSVGMV